METRDLIEQARSAREKAYAPYSNFKVGAALLTRDGRVFTGCNIENAAYGDAICAEKVAIIKAISEGSCDFSELVVVADSKEPSSPCGSCRQILFEFNPDLLVTMVNLEGDTMAMTVKELMPYGFALRHGNKLL